MPTLHISQDLENLINNLIDTKITAYDTSLKENFLYHVSREYVNDCNNMLTDGCYYWDPNTSNKPPENYGTIFVTVSNGLKGNNQNNWVNQLAFSTGNKIYYRQKINTSNFTTWKVLH